MNIVMRGISIVTFVAFVSVISGTIAMALADSINTMKEAALDVETPSSSSLPVGLA